MKVHQSEKDQVVSLLTVLVGDKPVNSRVSLIPVKIVKGYWLEKVKPKMTNTIVYLLWTPYERTNPVWAFGPPQFTLSRHDCVSKLREIWITDAQRWLKEVRIYGT